MHAYTVLATWFFMERSTSGAASSQAGATEHGDHSTWKRRSYFAARYFVCSQRMAMAPIPLHRRGERHAISTSLVRSSGGEMRAWIIVHTCRLSGKGLDSALARRGAGGGGRLPRLSFLEVVRVDSLDAVGANGRDTNFEVDHELG